MNKALPVVFLACCMGYLACQNPPKPAYMNMEFAVVDSLLSAEGYTHNASKFQVRYPAGSVPVAAAKPAVDTGLQPKVHIQKKDSSMELMVFRLADLPMALRNQYLANWRQTKPAPDSFMAHGMVMYQKATEGSSFQSFQVLCTDAAQHLIVVNMQKPITALQMKTIESVLGTVRGGK